MMHLGLVSFLLTGTGGLSPTVNLTPLILGGLQRTTDPRVVYAQVPERNLVTCNNPEQITTVDLGDANLGNTVIYRDVVQAGSYRSWYSHTNRTGATMGFGTTLVNNNSTPVTINTRGRGFNVGLLGGQCFSDMLQNYSTPGAVTTIPAGGRAWIARQDNIPNTQFFSGVIDFEVSGGPVTLELIGYRSFSQLTGNRTYMGYIQRTEPDGTRASRQYKGMSPFSLVQTPIINCVINDQATGALTLVMQDYDLTNQVFRTDTNRKFWFTNIGPGQNAQSNVTDMVTWMQPGWGPINPLTRSDGTNNFPNLGNWGVMYSVRATIVNIGTKSRNLSVNLQAPNGGGSPIAYRGNDGIWRHLKIDAAQNIQYLTLTVPARSSRTFDARYILGGPGAGSLRNTITVNN